MLFSRNANRKSGLFAAVGAALLMHMLIGFHECKSSNQQAEADLAIQGPELAPQSWQHCEDLSAVAGIAKSKSG